ncbi:methionyl-tRNA formyltransferase [Clostridia bacterium]|nr:methionyl-tRNA formyltransferase [Clostridia bacterium]
MSNKGMVKNLKVIFLGTPAFALPSLAALIENGYGVAAVVTQPDRPGNRNKTTPPPVKEAAIAAGVPVLQYEKIRRDGAAELRGLKPDVMITAAYGQILSKEILDIPKYGVINVHASLLPAYRGPAPINWAVARGETRTGVTIMRTDIGVDTGDMLLKRETDILPDENAAALTERLARLGADALIEALERIKAGKASYEKQDESKASYFPMLRKTDGEIAWNKSARDIGNLIRGLDAYTYCGEGILKIKKAAAVSETGSAGTPGEVTVSSPKEGLRVACGAGVLELLTIQTAGGKAMDAREYLRGRGIPVGTILCGQL